MTTQRPARRRSTALAAMAALTLGLVSGAAAMGAAEEFYGTLAKIDRAGAIAIGHRETSVPFSYLRDDGTPVGYTLDLCKRIAQTVRSELGRSDIEVRMVPVNMRNAIDLLLDGTIDLECGSTTKTLSRMREVDFSAITFITGTKLLVSAGSGIAEIEDLAGKTLAVSEATTNERMIREMRLLGGLDLELLMVSDHGQGLTAVETGSADAYATDQILLQGLLSTADDPGAFEVTGRFLSFEPYAIMLRRDDSAFRLVVDRTLADLFRTGEIFRLYDTWFKPVGIEPSDLLNAAFVIQATPD